MFLRNGRSAKLSDTTPQRRFRIFGGSSLFSYLIKPVANVPIGLTIHGRLSKRLFQPGCFMCHNPEPHRDIDEHDRFAALQK